MGNSCDETWKLSMYIIGLRDLDFVLVEGPML